MKSIYILVLISLSLLSAGPSQSLPSASSVNAESFSARSDGGTPLILYAEWIGKNLSVQGENFLLGATVIVDGKELKSSNDENAPGIFLFAKKAKKKVPRNQTIILQVRNPDGALSNEFTFYSGFVIGLRNGYNGTVQHLSVGDRFLLFLPPQGEPPTLQWPVGLGGTDQSSLTVLTRSMDNLPIPHAQGFFEVAHAGITSISAQASPTQPCPLPPDQCIPSGANFGTFNLIVIVE